MEAVTGWITSTVQDLRTMNIRQLVLQTLNLGACESPTFVDCLQEHCSTGLQAGANPTAGLIITSALIIWKSLILWTGSESPVRHPCSLCSLPVRSAATRAAEARGARQVVVVLSGSMEPAYYRGDILFLHMGRRPVRVGEVVVFNIEGRDIPIVHRVVKVHERRPGARNEEVEILTKARPAVLGLSRLVQPCELHRAWSSCPWVPVHLTLRCPTTQGDANYGNDYEGQLYADGQKWLNRQHIMGRVTGCAPPPADHAAQEPEPLHVSRLWAVAQLPTDCGPCDHHHE